MTTDARDERTGDQAKELSAEAVTAGAHDAEEIARKDFIRRLSERGLSLGEVEEPSRLTALDRDAQRERRRGHALENEGPSLF